MCSGDKRSLQEYHGLLYFAGNFFGYIDQPQDVRTMKTKTEGGWILCHVQVNEDQGRSI